MKLRSLVGHATALSFGILLATSPQADAGALFAIGGNRIGEANGIAAYADGSFVYAQGSSGGGVFRVMPNGRRIAVAGNGSFERRPIDGMPATAVPLEKPAKLALGADGTLLIAESSGYCTACARVLRVAHDGRISTLAGRFDVPGYTTYPLPGDNGPASEAPLGRSWMEPLPEGGFLIADAARIRRVDPAGTISTVAGTGIAGPYSGEGGRAVEATFTPTDVATLPDGKLAITSTNRILEMTGEGTIRTMAGSGTAGFSGDGAAALAATLNGPSGMEATADGAVLVADTGNDRVRRLTPDRRIETLAGRGSGVRGATCSSNSQMGYFNGQGRDARRATLCSPMDIVRDPLGGWLIAHKDGVSMLSEPGTARMAIAVTRPQASRNRLDFVTTTAGSATLEIVGSRGVTATVTTPVGAGANQFILPRGIRGLHTLRVRATNPGGTADVDRIRLLLGGKLPLRLGIDLIEENGVAGGARHASRGGAQAADGPYEYLSRCRRARRLRVDCVLRDSGSNACLGVLYLRLAPSGILHLGSYKCRSGGLFRRQLPADADSRPLELPYAF